ncbi:hypothetical protein [Pedobacter sp. MW01-1-1]|uniref:hypothetical protein n=1 Tax=Pedobacter sp. MW01-1-1 TaxID=3383027 RepID=UPI003FF103C9
MLVISSREFRQNQAEYFEKVDQGEQVIVQRGKNKSYALTPVTVDDIYFNSALLEKLKKSLSEVKSGEVKTVTNSAEIKELLGL